MSKANTTASKKAKGTRLEKEVARLMRKTIDKYSRSMPLSGAIEWMKGDIYNTLGLNIECKNQEKVKLWEWWQIVREKRNPRLIISGNHRPILVVIDINDWLELETYKKRNVKTG